MRIKIPALAAAATLAVSTVASAVGLYPDFTVSTTSIPGSVGTFDALIADSYVADQLNGSYREIITINPSGSFTSKIVATFTAALYNAAPVGTPLGTQTGMGFFYNVYAVMDVTGTASVGGFTGGASTISVYLDADVLASPTSFLFGATGADPITFLGSADDYLLGTASTTNPGDVDLVVPAAFNFFFQNFALTVADQQAAAGTQSGKTFFVAPPDFYISLHSDGDINEQTVGQLNALIAEAFGTGQAATGQLGGDLSADFSQPVPEPGALALAGLALGLMGVFGRKRNVL